MILQVRQFYAARSAREQRLIVAMLAIALPLLAWLLVVVPLSRAYEDALERHLQAVDRNGRVRALAGGGASRASKPAEGDLVLVVTDSATSAGLTLDSNTPVGPDSVTVAIGQAAPTAVTQWLGLIEAQGLRLDDLRIVPAGPGGVSMSARVSRPGA